LSIDKTALRDLVFAIAGRTKFRPAIIEKDYYLTIILNNINEHLSERIVFKGGTLLNKIYLSYRRLSEDLDFTHDGKAGLETRSKRSMAIAPIRESMGSFLESLGLHSDCPHGQGFNNSTQYVFVAKYPSFVTGKDETVEIEVSLRQPPLAETICTPVHHFFQDPFSGEDLLPRNRIRSLSFDEAVAEKLKAAITRQDITIRDYYDLWQIALMGFEFPRETFIELFKKKLAEERYIGDFRHVFGRSPEEIRQIRRQVQTDLLPVIRAGDEFDIDAVFDRFNRILSDPKFG
jgi:predicted nucleotidyltransferase component of viral defense system